jgi:hypothetical protein
LSISSDLSKKTTQNRQKKAANKPMSILTNSQSFENVTALEFDVSQAQQQLETGEVLSSISAIQDAIRSLPKELSLTPVKQKMPLREGWQSEPALSIDTLVSELDSGAWDGFGLRTGDISGGKLAIDFDGPSSQKIKDAMEAALGQLPPTVGWKSGKPGRYQLLYQVPEHYREKFKSLNNLKRSEIEIGGNLISCDKAGKKRDQIEFRYNKSQSVLPPSAHPETEGYTYLDGQSFDDLQIAILPDTFCEFILSLKTPKKPQSKGFKPREVKTGGTMTDHERDLKLTLEILEALPESEPGSGTYDPYRESACTLKNLVGESEAIAIMESHSPMRNWRQIIQSSHGNFDMGTVVKVAREFIPGWEYPQWWIDSMPKDYAKGQIEQSKVVSITKNKPTTSDWQSEVKELACSDLPSGELDRKLAAIASKNRVSLHAVEKVFKTFTSDQENELSRNENKHELEQIISATGQKIDLERLLVPELSKPILAYAKYLNVRPEVLLTAFLCGISAVHKVESKFLLNDDWVVYCNLFGLNLAFPGQSKSPGNRAVISKPINTLQDKADQEHESALADHRIEVKNYESSTKDERAEMFPDGAPEPPKRRAYLTTDLTMEGLFTQARNQNHGQLIYVDELAGLFKGMGQFKGGGGNDAQRLLEAYDSDRIHITRAKDGTTSTKALISVWGGMQPGVAKELFDKSNGDANGNWSRFLMIEQPFSKMQLTRSTVNISQALAFVYDAIDRQPETTYTVSDSGFDCLAIANDRWENSREHYQSTSPAIAYYFGKARGRAAKLAVNLHCVNYAAMGQGIPTQISESTMAAAVALTDFYNCQAISIYSKLMGDKQQSLPANLAKIIEMAKATADHTVTARQVSNRAKVTKTSGDAVALFNELQKMGYGTVVSVGRSHKFILNDTIDTAMTLIDTSLTPSSVNQKPSNNKGFDTISLPIDTIDTKNVNPPDNPWDTPKPEINPQPTISPIDTTNYEISVNGVKETKPQSEQGFTRCQSSVNEVSATVSMTPGSVNGVPAKNQLTPHEVFALDPDTRIWVKFSDQEPIPAIIYGGNDEVLRIGNHGDRIDPDWMQPLKLDDLMQGRASIYAAS